MRNTKILLISGIWVAILPYLGFPSFIKNILFSASGLAITLLSYTIYRKNRVENSKTFDNFSENKDFLENKF